MRAAATQVSFPLDDAGTVHYNAVVTWDLLSPTALSPEAFAADCAAKFGLHVSAAAALAASVSAQIERHLDRLPMSYKSKVQPAKPLQGPARPVGRPKKAAPARAGAVQRPTQQSQQQLTQQSYQQQLVQAAQEQQDQQQQLALAAQAAAQLPPVQKRCSSLAPARQMNYARKQEKLAQELPPHPSLSAYQAAYEAAYQQAPAAQQQTAYRVVGQGCSSATEQQMQALLLRRRAAGCVRQHNAVAVAGPCHLCRVNKKEVFTCCAEGCVSHALCETHLMIQFDLMGDELKEDPTLWTLCPACDLSCKCTECRRQLQLAVQADRVDNPHLYGDPPLATVTAAADAAA
eukprot:18344-Heterococcus_DN1.PRE.1